MPPSTGSASPNSSADKPSDEARAEYRSGGTFRRSDDRGEHATFALADFIVGSRTANSAELRKLDMAKSIIPNIADRLRAAQEARQAQLQRAKAAAESPEVAKRREERQAVVAARNLRIAERKAAEQARKEREAAERAAAEAAAAAARAAALQAEQETRAARELERMRHEAAEQAKREAILAARRTSRKAKKRRGG